MARPSTTVARSRVHSSKAPHRERVRGAICAPLGHFEHCHLHRYPSELTHRCTQFETLHLAADAMLFRVSGKPLCIRLAYAPAAQSCVSMWVYVGERQASDLLETITCNGCNSMSFSRTAVMHSSAGLSERSNFFIFPASVRKTCLAKSDTAGGQFGGADMRLKLVKGMPSTNAFILDVVLRVILLRDLGSI